MLCPELLCFRAVGNDADSIPSAGFDLKAIPIQQPRRPQFLAAGVAYSPSIDHFDGIEVPGI